jgi:predicted dehydrogenase
MAIDLKPEEKTIGQANFKRTVEELAEQSKRDPNRRQFMKGMLAGGVALPLGAAAYFGYQQAEKQIKKNPVKVALIGAGDEGGVLVGEHNSDYLQFVAVCDIRPYNKERIFTGEPTGLRKGFERIYGKETARKQIKVYDDYKQMLKERPDIEAVVIALPLHLHEPAALACLEAGKHVLCEKLMAWNITQCKKMIRAADRYDRVLSIGHQRHYSMLYAHARAVLESEVLGDIKHIRALWHRNQTWPRVDPNTGKPILDARGRPVLRDSWRPEIRKEDREALESRIRQLGYKSMEELVRWRLFFRTGGGLMAELGSHQLDACSIFLGKVHPLAVSGVGTRSFFRDEYRNGEREVDDHVFTTFEFPGKRYFKRDDKGKVVLENGKPVIADKDDVVVVNYSSINTNGFEPYGECVMGTRGSMLVESEASVMLWGERDPNNTREAGPPRSTSMTVTQTAAGQAVLDASASQPGNAVKSSAEELGLKSLGRGPVSKGYREEMEHFAYCVRMWNEGDKEKREAEGRLPHCHGRVAMADAIIALTSNLAMKHRRRIEFQPAWFVAEEEAVPDAENVVEEITG